MRGSFTYEDHGTPWSTSARDLNVLIFRPPVATNYLGRASFSDGTVKIQSYESFRTNMQSRFTIDGPIVHFGHMDLIGEGSRSVVTGDVDLGHWPEQTYQVRSKIDFPDAERDLLSRPEVHGLRPGRFHRHVPSLQGRPRAERHVHEPRGRCEHVAFSEPAGIGAVGARSPRDHERDRRLYGGTARFDYRMAPFGKPGVPTRATWDVDYRGVDLSRLTDFLEVKGLRLAGSATGKNRLEWPLGKWALKTGRGEVTCSRRRASSR